MNTKMEHPIFSPLAKNLNNIEYFSSAREMYEFMNASKELNQFKDNDDVDFDWICLEINPSQLKNQNLYKGGTLNATVVFFQGENVNLIRGFCYEA